MNAVVRQVTWGRLLQRVQHVLQLNQRELAERVGCSTRTIVRHTQHGGSLTPRSYVDLAKACHPRDPELAAQLAALAEETLESLGLVRAPEGPPRPAPAHLADSVVCAAAEAMASTPQAMRPALRAAFERAVALGMSADDVLKGIAPQGPRASKATRGA
ncbi:MAG TPA: hypothetical protein VIF15_04225 [Polyangiaceae bacterium]